MWSVRFAVFLLASLSAAAVAQPMRSHIATPQPMWSGFYFGMNLGYSWGRSSSDYSAVSANNGFVPELTSDAVNMNGAIGGAQVGYNYLIGVNYLAGLEADIQASGERGSGNPLICQDPLACDFGNINDSYTEKLLWFGTVRGRLGFLATPSFLLYGTGGLAFGELKRDDNFIYSAFFFCNAPPAGAGSCTPQSFSTNSVRAGWTLGAGAELKLAGHWSGKVEYLYMDLSGLGSSTFTLTSGNPTPILVTVTSHHFVDNILRVGLNYSLN